MIEAVLICIGGQPITGRLMFTIKKLYRPSKGFVLHLTGFKKTTVDI